MRISVYSATHFAVATARKLIADGHEIVLIDEDRQRLNDLAETLDCGMIVGDGTLPHILGEAFGDGADAFVALSEEDEKSILAAVVARSVGYPRVIPQITRTELLPIVRQLGLEETVTPEESVANALVAALEQRQQIATIEVLKNELRLVAVTLPEAFEPKPFADLTLPESARGVARIRDEQESILADDTPLAPGDRLLLVVANDEYDAVVALAEA